MKPKPDKIGFLKKKKWLELSNKFKKPFNLVNFVQVFTNILDNLINFLTLDVYNYI